MVNLDGDPEEAPGSHLQTASTPTVVAIGEMNQQMQNLFLSLSPSFSISQVQNKIVSKKILMSIKMARYFLIDNQCNK